MILRYTHYNASLDRPLNAAAAHQPDCCLAVHSASRTIARFQRAIHFLLALIVAIVSVPLASAQSYTPADIILPEGDYFMPIGLNDQGEVAGIYSPAREYERPAVWRNSVFTNLPLLPGAVSGRALGINNSGQVVGACGFLQPDGTYSWRACVWENGTVRALPSLPGATSSDAWAINDAGTIVGHAFTPVPVNAPLREAVIWQGSTVAKLVPPTVGARTLARAIDNYGRVAVSWTTGDDYSVDWNPARWTPNVQNGTLGTMITLGNGGSSFDINDSGVVSGNQGSSAYLWSETTNTAMDGLGGYSAALGINNAGVAVGSDAEIGGDISTAWVAYTPTDIHDLNVLLTYSSILAYPGSLLSAISINNAGQILVLTSDGQYTLLTPSSEPPASNIPAAPSNLSSYAADGVVDLYWTKVYSAESYNVKRATVSGGPYATIATGIGSGAYTDTSVVNGTTYYYVVSSQDGVYESGNSAQISAIPLAAPVAPKNLSAKAAKGGKSVNLAWQQSGSPEIRFNRVYRSVNGSAFTQIAQINAGTTYANSNLTRNSTYSYKVTAINVNGDESLYSNTVNIRPK